MTREELYQIHEEATYGALHTMRRKNIDYASEADPFRNFRPFGLLGLVVRMSDKICRLHSLVERGVDNNAVRDESVIDTLRDLINYSVIFEAMVREQRAVSDIPPSGHLQPGIEAPAPGCAECAGPNAAWNPPAGGLPAGVGR